jgi:hypothetical protein
MRYLAFILIPDPEPDLSIPTVADGVIETSGVTVVVITATVGVTFTLLSIRSSIL